MKARDKKSLMRMILYYGADEVLADIDKMGKEQAACHAMYTDIVLHPVHGFHNAIQGHIPASSSSTFTLPKTKQELLIQAIPHLELSEIAQIVKENWKKVSPFAEPYLVAMQTLTTIKDKYFLDDGSSIVAYFLSNATSWCGPVARAVKKELNKRLKEEYKAHGIK